MSELTKDPFRLYADLAFCLGVLRGMGKPETKIEERYGLQPTPLNTKGKELL